EKRRDRDRDRDRYLSLWFTTSTRSNRYLSLWFTTSTRSRKRAEAIIHACKYELSRFAVPNFFVFGYL
ncbi:hypothetical protein L2E82_17684, partial [Cichorium intybus]